MGISWTKEQEEVISVRDKNVLVSAAAGSGKTAVLVERIIKRITDETDPVDIDRLLVVTFTNAAAAEMRERIRDAIDQALEQNPDNVHLQKQYTLSHNAQITTIDSFCLYLIRNYFHKIDLEPAFRVGDEGELALMRQDVLEEVMEEFYQEKDPAFLSFVRCYGNARSDEPVKKMVLELFRYSESYPWPTEWLKSCTEAYQADSIEELEEKPWFRELVLSLKTKIGDMAGQLGEALELCLSGDGPDMYAGVIVEERDALKSMAAKESFEELSESVKGFAAARLPVNRKYQGSVEKKELVKSIRDNVKAELKKIKERYFAVPIEETISALKQTKQAAEVLVRVTMRFAEVFAETKKKKNLVDFSDMEHFALKILVDEETKEPTETALEFRELFKEIMIDEYQDSNYVQEAILTAVAKRLPEKPDMFMVGDVKQSIYRFRLARPELFMGKYESFVSGNGAEQRIDLHKNFRSRNEVLELVNGIFYKIMAKDLGRIDYDEEAALYPGAAYPKGEAGEFQAELLIADSAKETLEEAEFEDSQELEAGLVAGKIKELLKRERVTDKETGSLRPVEYRDMVILLRSLSGFADIFVKTLMEEGIPAYAASQTGYFSTLEVQTVLSVLNIVDNPKQDIPLTAVLRSAVGGFTPEELTKIRLLDRELPFHECVLSYPEKGTDQKIKEKLAVFLEKLNGFRKRVPYTPVHELLTEILQETGYLDYISALPGGSQRRANVEMLVEKAVAYEATSYHGLFHFIRYIEKLKKYDVDFGEADIVGEGENAVRIMSIHKSKGLEFPVVFVSAMGKQFNTQDTKNRMILHPEYGIGLDCLNEKLHVKSPTLVKRCLAKLTDDENMGEELRVLYVAMTRAKEKLILTGTMKKAPEIMEAYELKCTKDKPLSYMERTAAKSYLDWVIPAVLRDKDRSLCRIEIKEPDAFRQEEIRENLTSSLQEEQFALQADRKNEWDSKIGERLSYEYPFEMEKDLKTKVSVSELKHAAMRFEEEEAETVQWFEPEKKTSVIPAFYDGEKEVNRGALRGSAVHRVMECFDFKGALKIRRLKETERKAWIKTELDTMLKEQLITEEMYELVSVGRLDTFLTSSLAERLGKAEEAGLLYREKPFVMGLRAGDIYHNNSDETVLIQGIIDVFFYEEEKVIVLDYKTDSVEKPEQLINRYEKQLELYAEALDRITGKKTAEKLIYSFHLGSEIRLPQESR